jgi:hypothetical protein
MANPQPQPALESLSSRSYLAADPASVTALPLPPELPAGVLQNPRVMRLIDVDAVSHGLAHDTPADRASNQDVQIFLDTVQATAREMDPQSLVRCAASTATAAFHLDVLTASGNNQWSIRRGLDGADQVLLDEMNDLIRTCLIATWPGQRHAAQHPNLVILVGQDHIYAPSVRRLRLLGIPTWLIVPGRGVAASLYSCSCAVTFLGRGDPGLATGAQIKPAPVSSSFSPER